MPVYEYRCPRCGRKWSKIWTRFPEEREESELRCRSCGSGSLVRLFSTFSRPKSEDQRLESLADGAALSGLDERDPRSLARFMRKVSEETGEPLEGEEAEMLARMVAGAVPGEEGGGDADGGEGEFL